MNRITYLAAAGVLVATSGLGAWAADAAPGSTPAAHVRTTDRHGADDPAGHHRHHGADDANGHHRHSAGHHGSSATSEPGDDNGGETNAPEPGDDNGGGGSGSDDGSEGGGHHGGDDHGSDD